jgi:ketosteroid isomerase-like protein
MLTGNPEIAVKEFFRLFNTGDVEAVMAMYEPRAILVSPSGQAAEGATGLRAALNEFLSLKPTLTMGAFRLSVAGDLALSTVKWTLNGTGPDGQPVHMEGNDLGRPAPPARWHVALCDRQPVGRGNSGLINACPGWADATRLRVAPEKYS